MSRASREDLLKTVDCRYGRLTFPHFDTTVGKSLEFYGEWAQQELDLMLEIVPPGGTVLDVGAFVGTHTLAFACRVGPVGTVWACEPQPAVFELLRRNVEQNALDNVRLLECALGRLPGWLPLMPPSFDACRNFGAVAIDDGLDVAGGEVEIRTLDELTFERLDLIKADVEGMEGEVLAGGMRTLRRHRPSLHLECSAGEQARELLELLSSLDYRLFCHRPAAFNPANYFGCDRSIFGLERESALLALPDESPLPVERLTRAYPLKPVRSVADLEARLDEDLQAELALLPVASGPARLGIDQVNGYAFDDLVLLPDGRRQLQLESVGLFATGWAVAEGAPAEGVSVRIGARAFAADFGFERRDLAERYRDRRFLRSGFAFSLPPDLVAIGPLSIELTVESQDDSRCRVVEPLELCLLADVLPRGHG